MNPEIKHITKMLSLHHRSRTEVMEQAIIKRLDRSLFTYGKELDRGVSYVKDKSELNVLKKL